MGTNALETIRNQIEDLYALRDHRGPLSHEELIRYRELLDAEWALLGRKARHGG